MLAFVESISIKGQLAKVTLATADLSVINSLVALGGIPVDVQITEVQQRLPLEHQVPEAFR